MNVSRLKQRTARQRGVGRVSERQGAEFADTNITITEASGGVNEATIGWLLEVGPLSDASVSVSLTQPDSIAAKSELFTYENISLLAEIEDSFTFDFNLSSTSEPQTWDVTVSVLETGDSATDSLTVQPPDGGSSCDPGRFVYVDSCAIVDKLEVTPGEQAIVGASVESVASDDADATVTLSVNGADVKTTDTTVPAFGVSEVNFSLSYDEIVNATGSEGSYTVDAYVSAATC